MLLLLYVVRKYINYAKHNSHNIVALVNVDIYSRKKGKL